jgi:hypothetical protein
MSLSWKKKVCFQSMTKKTARILWLALSVTTQVKKMGEEKTNINPKIGDAVEW